MSKHLAEAERAAAGSSGAGGDGHDLSKQSRVGDIIKGSYGRLVRIARAKIRDPDLARDLVHEASAITIDHARSGRLTALDNVPGYVLGVMTNLHLNHRRDLDNRPEVRACDAVLNVLSVEDPQDMDTERLKQSARDVIAGLGAARDREIVKRFYLDEEDKEAICRDMQLHALRFDKVMYRARRRMRAVFDALGVKKTHFFCLLL